MLGLLLVACARKPDVCAPHGTDVAVALSTLPNTLDWNESNDQSAQNYPVMHAIMRGLTALGPRNEPVPGLADRWEIEVTPEHQQRYTFHLKPGTLWSDGKTPLTAQDFVFGWRRALQGNEGAEFNDVVGAEAVFKLRRAHAAPADVQAAVDRCAFRAVDDLTLEVLLRSPRSYFLARLATVYTFFPGPSHDLAGKTPQQIRAYFNEPDGDHPRGLGAFRVTRWDRVSQTVELEANPFARDVATDGRVTHLVLREAAISPVLYAQCGLDFLFLDDPALLSRAPADTQRSPLLSVYWLGLNTRKLPLKLRQAIAAAVDTDALLQGLLPQARPAHQFLPPDMPGAIPPGSPLLAQLPHLDVERARALLKESGFDGRELTLLVKGTQTFMPELGIADALRKQLERVGLKVKLVTTSNFGNDIKSADGSTRYDLFLKRTGADYAHPQTLFTPFLPTGNNYTEWAKLDGGEPIARFQTLLDEGAALTDPSAMVDVFAKAQALLLSEQAAVVPLYFPDRYYRKRDWIEGLGVDPFNFLTLRTLRIAGPARSAP
jgi:peptide/nickel transport system substrate-binding protein